MDLEAEVRAVEDLEASEPMVVPPPTPPKAGAMGKPDAITNPPPPAVEAA